MKRCMLCNEDKEDVTMYPVPPATWNGFNNFALACTSCAALTKNKTRLRITKAVTAAAAARYARAEAGAAEQKLAITHRRTGVTLAEVDAATLSRADLAGATLNGADLQHADLASANLRKADLRLSDLSGANLTGADLRAANLRGADLRGTDLRSAKLDQADLHSARYDRSTGWPDGFDPRHSGALSE